MAGLFSWLIRRGLPLVPKPIVGRVARRYVAGPTLDDALRKIEELAAEGAMATLDLLEVLLEQGRGVEAHRAANDVGRLLEPHKCNRVAAAALQRLLDIRNTAEGLTLATVEATRLALRRGRQLGLPPRQGLARASD